MSAQPAENHGLPEARNRIDDLLGELNATVELAGELANAGENESALALLDRQRRKLYQVVDAISLDIGTGPRPFWATVRRHAVVFAATLALSLSCVAMSLVALRVTPQERLEQARVDLNRAAAIADPTERLSALLGLHRQARTLGVEGEIEMRGELRRLVQQTTPEVPDDPENEGLKRDAKRIARDLEAGRAPEQSGALPQEPDDERDVERMRADLSDLFPG